MKHKPRPAIHMEKQLGWAYKVGGTNSVGQVDRVSEMALLCRLCGSVGAGFRKETMASAGPNARHFSSSVYATGAPHTATPALELRGSESE